MHSSYMTTTGVPASQQFAYWHDVVCKHFVTADSSNSQARNFEAKFRANSVGRLGVGELEAPAHAWSRLPKHIRRDGEEHYLLAMTNSGEGILQQNGRTASLRPGNVSVYDTTRPFSYALDGTVSIVKIPRKYLEARVPQIQHFLARNLASSSRITRVLSSTVDVALDMDAGEGADGHASERLADAIIDLLLVLLDLEQDGTGLSGSGYNCLDKIKAFAIVNLASPDLDPKNLADAGAVSTRTLNRLFGKLGTTPMRWILHERLKLGKEYLENGGARSVTEAAFMVGFNDLGHFSRSFKLLFGSTPEQILYRRG